MSTTQTKPSGATGIDREHQAYIDGLRQQLTEVKEAHKAALERGRAEYARRVKAESGLAELLEAAQRVAKWIDAGCDPSTKSLEALQRAIAKAINPNSTAQQVAPAGRWTEKGTV